MFFKMSFFLVRVHVLNSLFISHFAGFESISAYLGGFDGWYPSYLNGDISRVLVESDLRSALFWADCHSTELLILMSCVM